jgi:hypothetical protein
MCVRPEELVVTARLGRAGPNQIPGELKHAVERPQAMRLEFEGGIVADMRRAEFDRQRNNKEWLIEFPAGALRAL